MSYSGSHCSLTNNLLSFVTSTIVHTALIMVLALITLAPPREASVVMFTCATQAETTVLQEFHEMPLEQQFSPVNTRVDSLPNVSQVVEQDSALVTDVEFNAEAIAAVEPVDLSPAGDLLLADVTGTSGQATMFGVAGKPLSAVPGKKPPLGEGLVGRFFDLKQDRYRNKLPYGGTFPEYIATINRLADSGFSESALKAYYLADLQLVFSQLMIPATTNANDAPRAFNVDKVVEPRGWFVHYSGTVIPPKKGEWRFVGFFDDLLIVYVNGQPVLDGSWVPMCNANRGTYDQSLRQEFGGPGVSGQRQAYSGKWIPISGPTRIDILIGETPGGLVGGLLMCEHRGTSYQHRSDGTPILPLFTTSLADSERIRQDPSARRYQFAENPPIWFPQGRKR